MAESVKKVRAWLARHADDFSPEEWQSRLAPDIGRPRKLPPLALPRSGSDLIQPLISAGVDPELAAELGDAVTREQASAYFANIENFIGTVKLPVGLAGPLRMRGSAAQGDYVVPLATHEAALVASYHRGTLAISEAGGCTAAVLNEGVSRVPCFVFANLREAAAFLAWAVPLEDEFRRVAEATTRHGKLSELKLTVEGGNVYLHC